MTGKLTGFADVNGTGTSAGLTLLLGFLGGLASARSLDGCTPGEVLGLAGADLTGGTETLDVPSGMLIGTGLLLVHAGSLLLLRCLRFRLNTRPSSVLTSYDLTSTCCSTRALYHRPDLSVGFTRTTSPLLRGGSSLALML